MSHIILGTDWYNFDVIPGSPVISFRYVTYPCVTRKIHSFVVFCCRFLTHWGRVTHICVGNLTIIGSDNGLSPGRCQAITWTNVGISLIGPQGTNFSEMLIEIHTFPYKKIHLKMSSGKWRPFCLGLNVLTLVVLRPTKAPWFDVCYLWDHGGLPYINHTSLWLLCCGKIVCHQHQ